MRLTSRGLEPRAINVLVFGHHVLPTRAIVIISNRYNMHEDVYYSSVGIIIMFKMHNKIKRTITR